MDTAEGLPPQPNPQPQLQPDPPDRRGDETRRHDEDRRQKVICEFCESHLTPVGHAMKLSEKARHYRDVEELYEKAKTKIDDLERQLADVTGKLREAERQLSVKSKSLF